jgi:putative ABC transport system substrate-binding protein
MNRREFTTLLDGAAVAWPLAARAQQGGRPTTLGYLGPGLPEADTQRVNALVARLRELGWIEGRNLAIEYRWAHDRAERFGDIAADLIRLKVDVIVTLGSVVPAIKPMTSVIPVVFAVDADPVGRGLVESLARPGGNITGLSVQSIELVGKRLEILREIAPQVRRLGVLANAGFPGAMHEADAVQVAAAALSLEPVLAEMRSKQDIGTAFDKLGGRVDALYVCGDPLAGSNRYRINVLAVGARLPTIHTTREYAEAYGLASYGVSYVDLYRRAAEYVDKILRGTKAADLPVEQPTKFELVVNLITAKALGLKIPEAFLLRADEVIE